MPMIQTRQSQIHATERAALWTAAFATVGLFISMAAMNAFHLWHADFFALLFLSPHLLAFGWLACLLVFRASIRAHHSLAAATAILAVATALDYVPQWKDGSGGCMAFLIVFASLPLLIGFPITVVICWFLSGIKRHD